MKLKKTIASLALLVILSGCAGNNSTEKDTGKVTGAPITDINNSGMFPETSGNGNNSGMTTENNPFSYTAEDVFRLLRKAGDETNFTMAYSIMTEEGNVTYENVYTSKYIYFDYAKAGYMCVKDYAGENLLYNFDQKDGEFVVENALAYDDESGKRVAIRSTEEMNLLHGALNGKDSTVFEQRQRAFYTEDKTTFPLYAISEALQTLSTRSKVSKSKSIMNSMNSSILLLLRTSRQPKVLTKSILSVSAHFISLEAALLMKSKHSILLIPYRRTSFLPLSKKD